MEGGQGDGAVWDPKETSKWRCSWKIHAHQKKDKVLKMGVCLENATTQNANKT